MAATQEPTPKYTPQVNKRARKKAAAEDKKVMCGCSENRTIRMVGFRMGPVSTQN